MQTYIGTKTIKAEPAVRCNNAHPFGEDGYKVVYPDGYESWSPKDVFEAAYKVADTWLDRLRIEEGELCDRLDKLHNYLETPAFEALDEDSAVLLLEQRAAMVKYHEALTKRIAKAGQ